MFTIRHNYKDYRISPYGVFPDAREYDNNEATWEQKARASFFFWMYSRFAGKDDDDGLLARDMAFDARSHNLPAFKMTPEEWLDRVAGAAGAIGNNSLLRCMRSHVESYRAYLGSDKVGAEYDFSLDKAIDAVRPRSFFHRRKRQLMGF